MSMKTAILKEVGKCGIYDGILFTHKKNILSYTTTWMKLEDIMFSEIEEKTA